MGATEDFLICLWIFVEEGKRGYICIFKLWWHH